MSIEKTIVSLLALSETKCKQCKTVLIIQEVDSTIIKSKLMKIYKSKGVIEIKCRQCGKLQTVYSS
jgi:hypothetical protein